MFNFFNNNKNIIEHAANDESYPDVSSSKNFIPEWYKKTTKFLSGNSVPNILPLNMSFKACSPFIDSFTSGYMIPLAVDIAIDQSSNGPLISWVNPTETYVVQREKTLNEKLPTPIGFSENHYAWFTQHTIKIPKGYSALITHPLNRYDLPFITMSGIIDGEFAMYPGNLPVFFSSTFSGIIKAGTPIAQILLFKTENWESKKNLDIIEYGRLINKKTHNAAIGFYKETFWKKKMYE